jgi:hypothetical protein
MREKPYFRYFTPFHLKKPILYGVNYILVYIYAIY